MNMVEDDPSAIDSIKEKVTEIGQKVGEASKKAAKKTSEVSSELVDEIKIGARKVSDSDLGQKVGEASIKAAKKTSDIGSNIAGEIKSGAKKVVEDVENKRDEIRERREKKKIEKIESDLAREDEIKKDMKTDLFPISTPTISSESHIKNSEIIVPEVISNNSSIIQNNPDEGLKSELSKTINDVLQTLLVSVIWAGALSFSNTYVKANPIELGGLPFELLIWPIGTAIWSFYILHRLVRSRTFLSMPFGMRIQTSIGIGLATELAILLTSETEAITNIWGWTAIVALTATLLSGLVRGIGTSFSRLLKINRRE